MAEKYQTVAKKSTRKFEVLGRGEVAMSVPLPFVEVWEDLQPEVEHLTGIAGLRRNHWPRCGPLSVSRTNA